MKIILIGAGGHAKVVIDTIRSRGKFEIAGLIDSGKTRGSLIEQLPVLGNDEDMPALFKSGITLAFLSLGALYNIPLRRRVAATAASLGFSFPALTHERSFVADSAAIGDGALIAAGSLIQPGVTIGAHAIINTGAVIDHDCVIGDFTHIAPGAVLSGNVKIGSGTLIGTGSTIKEGITIGNNCLIGAGSVVVKDIPDQMKAFGSPCRVR